MSPAIFLAIFAAIAPGAHARYAAPVAASVQVNSQGRPLVLSEQEAATSADSGLITQDQGPKDELLEPEENAQTTTKDENKATTTVEALNASEASVPETGALTEPDVLSLKAQDEEKTTTDRAHEDTYVKDVPSDLSEDGEGAESTTAAEILSAKEANVTESGMDESDVLSLESQDAADTTEDPAELLEADTTEDPAQLLSADDTTEAPAELLEADTTEDPAQLLRADDTTEAPAELLEADTTEDPAQLLRADDTTEAPAELLEADTTEAPTELVHADTTEEPAELIRADTTEEPSELVRAKPSTAARARHGKGRQEEESKGTGKEDGAHAEESEGKDEPAMSKGEESKGKDTKTKMIEGDDADVEESGSEGKTAMKAKKMKMIKADNSDMEERKSTAKSAVKAKKTKIIKDEQAATAPSSAELAAAQSVVARKLIAITSALVKVTNIINFAQNISSQAKIMIGEDLYLGADITNSLHVSGGLNKALFKHGSDMIPNQNRLNLKINEIEAELQAFKVHYNDIMPAGRNVPLGA